jgi:hypothetical protein
VVAEGGLSATEDGDASSGGSMRLRGTTHGNRWAGDWCSGGGGVRVAGRLVDDGGAAGKHQGVRVNSMVALARPVMARSALTACDHGTGATAALRWCCGMSNGQGRGTRGSARARDGGGALDWDEKTAHPQLGGALPHGNGGAR